MRDIEKRRAAQARWRERNRDKIAAYKAANKAAILAYAKDRYAKLMADPALAVAEKKRRKDYYEANKEYVLGLTKKWRAENPERVKFNDRNKALVKKYGITEFEYRKMHAEQGGKCAICGQPEVNKMLAVDHCHKTGRVRKLLCGRCNGALGWYEKHTVNIGKYLSNG